MKGKETIFDFEEALKSIQSGKPLLGKEGACLID